MNRRNSVDRLAFLLCVASLAPLTASALIMTGRGNQPVRDAGWPEGALAVANLKSRVGWWEGPPFGGGEWQFLYRGDTEAFTQALTNFAAILAPALELVVHDGSEHNQFLKDDRQTNADTRVDWTFTVWNPASWYRLYNNPKSYFAADQPQFREPVAPPRLDVYIGGGGQVDWAKVKVPDGLQVRDERASAFGVKPVGGAIARVDVFDMATGKPVPGAQVLAARWSNSGPKRETVYEKVAEAVSDESGRAQVEKIPPGTYRVSVAADGYVPRVIGYHSFKERTFKPITAELAKPASLSGVVTDTDGKAVPDVTVRVSNPMAINGRGYTAPEPPTAVTDTAGRFELNDLPMGYTQLSARATGYYFSDLFTLHDVPSIDASLRLTRAGRIRVAVTDRTGQPLASLKGASVMVNVEPAAGAKVGTWGGSAQVQADGTYEFTGVPPGEYRITSQPNPATTGKPYAPERVIKLAPGATVAVTIAYY